jgi:hypothetical protein
MKHRSFTIAWPVLALACGPGLAQPARMQPGLWEQQVTMKSASGQMEAQMAQMQQQLASMPSEQRKMVEDMMARQGAGMGGKPNTVRLCISPEQAERSEVAQHDGNCRQEVLQRNGSTLRYRFSCTGDHAASGEGEYTLASPTRYSGRSTVLMQVQGKPEKLDMTTSGRWVAADCGAIKPRVMPK